VPGGGLNIPLWILGSSTFGAQLAAHLGLPYAFASHFAPDALMDALAVYRARFQSSTQSQLPHAMIGVNVVAADTDKEARYLFTTTQQAFTNLARGRPGPQQPPIDDIEQYWSPSEKLRASHMLMYSIVGSAETVSEGLRGLVEATRADELMVVSNIYDHAKRVRSYEIVADVARS
jgi:luciferase family oxidoreductase group 1